jgi:ubiquinone/menaquinone biosynthesis C-methylase UbiE
MREEGFVISGIDGIRGAYQDAGVARRYVEERFMTPLGALLHDRQSHVLRSVVSKHDAPDVLEIAPGPARLTGSTIDVAGRLTLLDASAEMLGEARRRLSLTAAPARCTLVRGDAFSLPFASRFDLVYSFRLIRHFGREDRLRLYREAARVLKPGGLLIFDAVNQRVYEPMQAGARDLEHYDASFQADVLRAELADVGFKVESLAGAQHRYAALYRLQVLLAPRSAKLARMAMNVVDGIGGGEPLEWIVTCRRV